MKHYTESKRFGLQEAVVPIKNNRLVAIKRMQVSDGYHLFGMDTTLDGRTYA